jgi:hypothetical protein
LMLVIVVGLVAPIMALWVWKAVAHYPALPGLRLLKTEMVVGRLRQPRGPRRRDEGRP